jgi:hypothetical protein
MEIDKQDQNTILEEILSHLDESMRLCKNLDFSEIPGIDQSEWENRMKVCKDAIGYIKGSVQRLQKILK